MHLHDVGLDGCEGPNGIEREDPSDHRGSLDHDALLRTQTINARREERLDRRGDRDRCEVGLGDPVIIDVPQKPRVDHHRERLFHEQGIALGRLRDPRLPVLLRGLDAHEVRDELTGLLLGERLEVDGGDVELATRPGAPLVQQLRTGQTDEQDRRFARPVGDMLDEIQERGLGPVDVLEHKEQRALRPRASTNLRNAQKISSVGIAVSLRPST